MRKYLIYHNDKARFIELDAAATSSDDWGRLQLAFADEARGGKPPEGVWDKYAHAICLYDHCIAEGLHYDEWLSGCDGMSFMLIAPVGTPDEQVNKAKAKLRCDRDVVSMRVMRPELI